MGKLKSRIVSWIIDNVLEEYNYVHIDFLDVNLDLLEDTIMNKVITVDSFEEMQYDLAESNINVEDHEKRVFALEEKIKEIDVKIKEYDKIFSRLKAKFLLEEVSHEIKDIQE